MLKTNSHKGACLNSLQINLLIPSAVEEKGYMKKTMD